MVAQSKTGAYSVYRLFLGEYESFCLIVYAQLYLLLTYVRTNIILFLCTGKDESNEKDI